MDTSSFVTSAVSIMISIGVLALGFGYAYSQFMKGKNGGDKDAIDKENALVTFLKNQNEGLERMVREQDEKRVLSDKEHAKELAQLRNDLDTLKAIIEQKDISFKEMVKAKNEEIEKYLKILQNRNPELEAFMKKISKAADSQLEFNGELMKGMKNISEFMKEINEHMKADMKVEGVFHKSIA